MSLYSQRLAKLKKDISVIKSKKKKKFTKDQQIMIDFINGLTKSAIFHINNQEIILYKGDGNKGFIHILLGHFSKGCNGEVTAMDILNITTIIKQGIRLSSEGVSNKSLIVYQKIKGLEQYKLVLKPMKDNQFVVTMYRIG